MLRRLLKSSRRMRWGVTEGVGWEGGAGMGGASMEGSGRGVVRSGEGRRAGVQVEVGY